MISSFRHKGLKRLYEDDDPRGLDPGSVRKIRQILAALDVAETIEDMNLPTLGLHPLKGDLAGCWSVTVRANWRVVFQFSQGEAVSVDLVDYH